MARGRKRLFSRCPHCGSKDSLITYGKRRAGHINNIYAECNVCLWRGCYVIPKNNSSGYWRPVKDINYPGKCQCD